MDYKIGLHIKGLILILITTTNLVKSELDRDILLTPQHSLQVNGKILYFRPQQNRTTNEVLDKIPWEQALKHVTFLTLNNHLADASDLSELPEYKRFMNSSYVPTNLYIPKFGDIITLAKGRLESNQSNGEYRFIEGLCNDRCDPKHTEAFWQVEKIRHRDDDNNFRYEIRLTVNTKMNLNSISNERQKLRSAESNDSEQSESRTYETSSNGRQVTRNTNVKRSQRTPRILRSFILKENDYPSSFSFLDEHLLRRHNSASRTAYLDKLNAFNDIFNHPRYFQTQASFDTANQLNTGEIILPRKAFPTKQGLSLESGADILLPFVRTTFRPNYNQKFAVPNSYQYPSNAQTLNPYASINHAGENFTPLPYTYELLPNSKVPLHKQHSRINKPFELHSHNHYYNSPYDDHTNAVIRDVNYSTETASAPPPFFRDHQTTVSLIEQPLNTDDVRREPFVFRTPSSISNQIPIPPSQAPVQYSLDTTYPGPPPPIVYGTTQHTPYTEFNENANLNNNNQNEYSSRDPIYHPSQDSTRQDQLNGFNAIIPTNNYDSYNPEYKNQKPDSINAQLPPPEKGQDVKVPYVDSSVPATKSPADITTAQQIYDNKEQNIYVTLQSTASTRVLPVAEQTTVTPKNLVASKSTRSRGSTKRVSTTQSNNTSTSASTPVKAIGERSRQKSYRSTTERPVLKWKSKRGKITREYPTTNSRKQTSTSAKYEFEKVYVDEKVATVTPSKENQGSNKKNGDVPTKKSIATSISYKVGRDKLQKPFKPTVKIPNVEIVEASLVKLPTPNHRDVKLFKATEDFNEKPKGLSKEDIELTETIVDHARNL